MHFEKLKVWEEGMILAKLIKKTTDTFPRKEWYRLVDQMQRAAVSVPSNIAEGSQRSRKEFAHFILISRGSLAELHTQTILAADFGYLSMDQSREIRSIIDRLSRMLHVLHSKLITHDS